MAPTVRPRGARRSVDHYEGLAPGDHLSYSPWCVPTTNEAGQKCVIVHLDLRDAEVMAWDFVMNFARDNDLQTMEACLLSTSPENDIDPSQQQAAEVPAM